MHSVAPSKAHNTITPPSEDVRHSRNRQFQSRQVILTDRQTSIEGTRNKVDEGKIRLFQSCPLAQGSTHQTPRILQSLTRRDTYKYIIILHTKPVPMGDTQSYV